MQYKKFLLLLLVPASLLSSCLTTKVSEKAAYLSNDKVYQSQHIDGINIVNLSTQADKNIYEKISSGLQEKLTAKGISSNMLFLTDTEDRAIAKSKIADPKSFIIFLTPIKKMNALDEMNNPFFQKQMEFLVETKDAVKIVSGLISIDKETTQSKLGSTIADIIFGYLKSKKLV